MTEEETKASTLPAPPDPDATLDSGIPCPNCGLPSVPSEEAGWRVCSGLHRFHWPPEESP
jgi:hypothetical protein